MSTLLRVSVVAMKPLVVLLVALLCSAKAHAQCEPQWQPFDPTTASFSGTNGGVYAINMWDPDGPGPQASKLVVAGDFSVAGSVVANRIATFNPSTGLWESLGLGMNRSVRALATLPNGDLIAGGEFTTSGGISLNGIARWNQTAGQWAPLGTGVEGGSGFTPMVLALATHPNGDIFVGGSFTRAGGVAASRIARWNAATAQWVALGTGLGWSEYTFARALTLMANGDLVVAGSFSHAGGVAAYNIARLNVVTGEWAAMGAGVRAVYSLVSQANGDLIAGGAFTTAGGVAGKRIARWDAASAQWAPLGAGVGHDPQYHWVNALLTLPNGDLIAGGSFTTAGGVAANRIARWSTATGEWTPLGLGVDGSAEALTVLPNGDLVVGGFFSSAGDVRVGRIARWNATADQWGTLDAKINDSVHVSASLPSGDLIVGGKFNFIGDVPANYISRWNATTQRWTRLGNGIGRAAPASVNAFAILSNGDFVVGGYFFEAGGVAANSIARWNPVTEQWAPLGAGIDGVVRALSTLPDGDLIVAGEFARAGGILVNHIARWSPTTEEWAPLGRGVTGASNNFVRALATLPNGELVVGGQFYYAGEGISAANLARYNPSTGQWTALSVWGLNNSVYALAALPNGDVIAGGSFTTAGAINANRIARWNAATGQWASLGAGLNGNVNAIVTLPSGHLAVSGAFSTAGGIDANVARWNLDSEQWASLATGMNGGVSTLTTLPNGGLFIGGSFTAIGGVVAPYLARLDCVTPTCDPIDFNQNSLFPEDADLIDFLSIFAGGPCSPGNTCNDIDFNNDGLFPSDDDLVAFLRVLAGGTCN